MPLDYYFIVCLAHFSVEYLTGLLAAVFLCYKHVGFLFFICSYNLPSCQLECVLHFFRIWFDFFFSLLSFIVSLL